MKLLTFTACALAVSMASAQQNSTNDKYSSSSSELSSSFRVEALLGVTSSFAYGDYIDYHRSFLSVEEEGTEFKGGIRPIIFGTAGIQARIMPFKNELLQNLGFSIGLQYVQKGFLSRFKMNYTSASDFSDVLEYKEIYRHHYLAVPVQARWGKKWFGTVGLSFSRHLTSTRVQKMKHDQSGAGALNGGFDVSDSGKKKIHKSLMNKSGTDFIVGGGYQLNNEWSVAFRANFGAKIFKDVADNYKTVLLDLSLITKI